MIFSYLFIIHVLFLQKKKICLLFILIIITYTNVIVIYNLHHDYNHDKKNMFKNYD